MRDAERIGPMLQALGEAWMKNPDLRLGQLVNNAPYFNADGTPTGGSIPSFLVEDDVMRAGLIGMCVRETIRTSSIDPVKEA